MMKIYEFGLIFHFSLNFVPKVQINNVPELVKLMACRMVGAKPLYEQILEHC